MPSGMPIDVAIQGGPRSLAKLKLGPASVFMVLGEGDLESRDNVEDRVLASVQSAEEMDPIQRLSAIMAFEVQSAMMGGAARVRLKALTKSGWDVHLIHHRALQRVLQYDRPKKPLGRPDLITPFRPIT